MLTTELCPECRVPRDGRERLCKSCHFDFESLSYLYRGTGFSQQNQSVGARTFGEQPSVTRPIAAGLLRIGLFLAGVAALSFTAVRAVRNGTIANAPLSNDQKGLAVIIIPLIAGVVSMAIPGKYARGLGKSILVGVVGWIVAGVTLASTTDWWLATGGDTAGVIDHLVAAVVGATIIRLGLLLVP